jgi:hypothetical protein
MPALGVSLAASGAVGVASDLNASSRMLPVHGALAGLFPSGGLRRGTTVGVGGCTSLLLALLAAPTAAGSWAAVVGMPELGVAAAAELGVAVGRLALVRDPGMEPAGVVAALLDGMDVVAVARGRLTEAHARRLSARARHRGAVLLTVGPWPGVDLELRGADSTWHGLYDGAGYLTHRELRVNTRGRGTAARPQEANVHLPAQGGTISAPEQWVPLPRPEMVPTA